jgi:hypothetical protein
MRLERIGYSLGRMIAQIREVVSGDHIMIEVVAITAEVVIEVTIADLELLVDLGLASVRPWIAI